MVIRNNMSALRTYNLLNTNQSHAQKHMLKVSTGMKIHSAQDDASAYSISERMRVRIRALDQAYQNTQNGSSMIKTAEAAVSNILETLRTLKEKAIDAANDSNTNEDRRIIQKEFNQLVDQIDDDALVQFNSMYLIDNSRNNALFDTKGIMFNKSIQLTEDGASNLKFFELKDRAGNDFGILESDKVIYSVVSNAKHYYGELKGTDDFGVFFRKFLNNSAIINGLTATNADQTALSTYGKDKFGKDVLEVPGKSYYTKDGAKLYDQITSLTFTVTDAQGNIKQFQTTALRFKEINRAESKTGDRALSFQVGAEANQATKVALTDMRTIALGLKGNKGNIVSISTKDDANAAINVIDNVIKRVLDEQSNIGSFLSRLEYTATNLTTSYTNDTASESVIRDADMATEMSGYVRYNVLTQSAQAMLAQANQNPLNVLALLR